MALEYLQILDKRAGVGSFTRDVIRKRSRERRGRTRISVTSADGTTVVTSVAGTIDSSTDPIPDAVSAASESAVSAGPRISVFSDMPGFTKQVELALASRDAASGAFREKLPKQGLVRFRPEDNNAFIKNTILGAAASIRTGVLDDTLFSDQDRSLGMFEKKPVQATITIQANVMGKTPLVVTNQFILASVSESSQEKYQIYQTFDEDLIYFFDRNPHIYTYGGVLYNADEVSDRLTFNWKNRFQEMYEKKLRGTKCVDNNAHAILTYEDVTRQGYLLNFQMSEDANNPMNIPFSFLFFVTKESNNVSDASLFPTAAPLDDTSRIASNERLRLFREALHPTTAVPSELP